MVLLFLFLEVFASAVLRLYRYKCRDTPARDALVFWFSFLLDLIDLECMGLIREENQREFIQYKHDSSCPLHVSAK